MGVRHSATATAIAAIVALAGCGADGGGGGFGIGHTDSGDPLFAKAPAPLQVLETIEMCGRENLSQLERLGDGLMGDRAARRCLERAWRGGRPAELLSISPTYEGGPIRSYFRVHDGDVLVLTDSTSDRFGPRRWTAQGCLELDTSRLGYEACSIPLEVREQTAVEVIERRTLPSCGRVRPAGVPKNRQAVYGCARAARRVGDEVEFQVIEPAEEHPTTRIVRLTNDGVELYEDSGGYSPEDDRWRYSECERVTGHLLEPRDCSEPERLGLTPAGTGA